MKHILPIVLPLLSAGICLSDMGPIPIKETEIREPVQNAIVLFDQDRKKETIILQTQLVSTRSTKGMFFMPLPSNPEVSTADPDVFSRVVGFAKECGVTFILADATGDLNSPGGGLEPKVRGISVVFTKNIAEHDITVIRVESWENLRQWIVQYVIDKRLPVDFDLQKIQDTVQAYTKDEIRYFLFDVVELTDQAKSTKPSSSILPQISCITLCASMLCMTGQVMSNFSSFHPHAFPTAGLDGLVFWKVSNSTSLQLEPKTCGLESQSACRGT